MPVTIPLTAAETAALGATITALDDAGANSIVRPLRIAGRTAKMSRSRGVATGPAPTGTALTDTVNAMADNGATVFLTNNPSATYAAALAYGANYGQAFVAIRSLYLDNAGRADAALLQLDALTGASHG